MGKRSKPRGVRTTTSALISAGAVGLAVVHLAFPKLELDGITMGFAAIAVLPWLLPFLKSAKIPGIGEFEFQDLKRQVKAKLDENSERVEQVANRVERAIEQFAIAGASSGDVTNALNAALATYYEYLKTVGFDVADKPRVEIKTRPGSCRTTCRISRRSSSVRNTRRTSI